MPSHRLPQPEAPLNPVERLEILKHLVCIILGVFPTFLRCFPSSSKTSVSQIILCPEFLGIGFNWDSPCCFSLIFIQILWLIPKSMGLCLSHTPPWQFSPKAVGLFSFWLQPWPSVCWLPPGASAAVPALARLILLSTWSPNDILYCQQHDYSMRV